MAILRNSEIKKMSQKDLNAKLTELKLEIVKANVTANKANAKTKEIKRAISRINTFNKMTKKKQINKPAEKPVKEELKKK